MSNGLSHMVPMLSATVVAHGATGTWLDEIVEIGIPLTLFVALYFWSSKKERTKKAPRKDSTKSP